MASTSDSDWFQKEVDKSLKSFSQSLQIPGFRESGKRMCREVLRTLEKEITLLEASGQVSFSVSDTFYGGSYARNTDILMPDFTLVFRLNSTDSIEETCEEAVVVFKDLLIKNSQTFNVLPLAIRTGSTWLRFWFKNGVQVDISIAPWMKHPQDLVAKIGENMDDKTIRRFYSNSLIERQIPVIAELPEITRKLIRLMKFWKSQCDLSDSLSNLDAIVELVCMAAALEEQACQGGSDVSITSAIIRTFDILCSLDSLKLVFRCINGVWSRLSPEALSPEALGIVPKIVGHADMLKKKRLLLEPMNPFSDLLEDIDDRGIQKIVNFAQKAKARFQGIREQKYCSLNGGLLVIQYEKLFEPQPLLICPHDNVKLHFKLPSQIYLSQDRFQHRRRSSSGNSSTARPAEFLDIKIRRNEILAKPEIQHILDLVTKRVLGSITCSGGGLKNLNSSTNDDMLKIVWEMLRQIFPSPPVVFSGMEMYTGERLSLGCVKTLDPFDVTISFPFSSNVEAEFCYGIRVSLKWGP